MFDNKFYDADLPPLPDLVEPPSEPTESKPRYVLPRLTQDDLVRFRHAPDEKKKGDLSENRIWRGRVPDDSGSAIVLDENYEQMRMIVCEERLAVAQVQAARDSVAAMFSATSRPVNALEVLDDGTSSEALAVESVTPNPVARKRRGRPQEIPDERKAAAAEKKASGGTNRDAAILLYVTRHPSVQQVKNVSSHLKAYRKKISKQAGSSIRTSPKPRKISG